MEIQEVDLLTNTESEYNAVDPRWVPPSVYTTGLGTPKNYTVDFYGENAVTKRYKLARLDETQDSSTSTSESENKKGPQAETQLGSYLHAITGKLLNLVLNEHVEIDSVDNLEYNFPILLELKQRNEALYQEVVTALNTQGKEVVRRIKNKIPPGSEAFALTELPIYPSKSQRLETETGIRNEILTPEEILALIDDKKIPDRFNQDGLTIDQLIVQLKLYSSKPVEWPYKIPYRVARLAAFSLTSSFESMGSEDAPDYFGCFLATRPDALIAMYDETDGDMRKLCHDIDQIRRKAYFQISLLNPLDMHEYQETIRNFWSAIIAGKIKLHMAELKGFFEDDISSYIQPGKIHPKRPQLIRHAAHQLKAFHQVINQVAPDAKDIHSILKFFQNTSIDGYLVHQPVLKNKKEQTDELFEEPKTAVVVEENIPRNALNREIKEVIPTAANVLLN